MKFGKSKIEVPPVEVHEELTPEQLEAKRYSVELQEEILAAQDEWSAKIAESGLPTSDPAVLPFAQTRAQARQLAQAYGSAKSEEDRAMYMSALTDKLKEFKGPRTENLQKAIENRQAEKDFTVKEKKDNFRASVEKFKTLGNQLPKEKINAVEYFLSNEKQAMDVAESAYLDEYKKFYATKGAKEKNQPEELKQLKAAYDESRITYGNALTASAKDRLESRGMKPRLGEKKEISKGDILERYNRIVRYNEIIKPAAEKRYNARIEAIGEREKGILSKGIGWMGSQNKKLEEKIGKNGARFVKALSTTVIAGGVGVATGALAAFGPAALVGWGTWRIARAVGSSLAAAGAGEAAAQLYGASLGRILQNRSENKLKIIGRTGQGLTIEDLEKYDREREGHERGVDQRTLEQEKMVLRALVALGVGAGISTSLQGVTAASNADLPGLAKGQFDPKMSTHQFSEYMKPHVEPTHTEVPSAAPAASAVTTPVENTASVTPAPVEHHASSKIEHHHATKHVQIREDVSTKQLTAKELGLSDDIPKVEPGVSSANPEATPFARPEYAAPEQELGTSSTSVPPVESATTQADTQPLSNPESITPAVDTGATVEFPEAPGQSVPTEMNSQPEITSTVSHPEAGPVVSESTESHEVPQASQAAESTSSAQAPTNVETIPQSNASGIDHPSVSAETVSPVSPETTSGHVDQPPDSSSSLSSHLDSTAHTSPETATANPESSQDIVVNGGKVFENRFGVPVDLNVAHAYQIKGYDNALVMTGGTPEERFAKIEKFYSDPLNYGTKTTIYSPGGVLDPKTGKPYLNSYHSNGDEGYIIETKLMSKHGGFLGLFTKTAPSISPEPDSFTKRVL
ncbi:MAG: hypothetical protein ABIT47_03015 [Candidatus Paceibacterota bacterium]